MKTLSNLLMVSLISGSALFAADTTTEVAPTTTKTEVVKIAVDEIKAAEGKTLFASCVGCHGANAEKKALGKSQVIAGWDIETTTKALNGYKDGSYGGAMKGVMKGQAMRLDDKKIEAIAHYVASLGK